MKIKGIPIQPDTIFQVRFSFKGVEQLKCTSTNTYKRDAEKFAEQFKKVKDVCVTMEVLKELGKEHSSFSE